jgi:hypothetical protein
MEIIPAKHQTPEQRESVRELHRGAKAAWRKDGHAGWTLFPLESDDFASVSGWRPALLFCLMRLQFGFLRGSPAAADRSACIDLHSTLTSTTSQTSGQVRTIPLAELGSTQSPVPSGAGAAPAPASPASRMASAGPSSTGTLASGGDAPQPSHQPLAAAAAAAATPDSLPSADELAMLMSGEEGLLGSVESLMNRHHNP